MQPTVALEYRSQPETRPRWVTALAVTSLILGTLGAIAGGVRSRDAWTYVFDSTFRWDYPPAVIVPPLYLAAVLAAIVVSVFLTTAGVVSLVRPAIVLRVHLV